jgi:hypothetical protein
MSQDNRWKLVPVEPTQAMIDNAFDLETREERRRGIWAMMLAAAPLAPLADAATTETAAGGEVDAGQHWQHVKRGTVYEIVGSASLQMSADLVDGSDLVVYRGEDGKLWAREEGEFTDGRFTLVTNRTATTGASAPGEVLSEACKPWEFHAGEPPEYDSPLAAVYDAGIGYAYERLAELLDVTDYQGGDGSEDYATDVMNTGRNILIAAGYADDDGDLLKPAALRPIAPPAQDERLADAGDGGVREQEMRRRAVAQEIDGMGRECAPSPSALAAAGRIIALGLVTEPVPATPSASEQRIAALEAENADLKSSVLAFGAPWAVTFARDRGMPDGHLHPTHYDILKGAGGRMDAFTRALIAGEDGHD